MHGVCQENLLCLYITRRHCSVHTLCNGNEAKATKDVDVVLFVVLLWSFVQKWVPYRRISSGFSFCGLLLQSTMETYTLFTHPTVIVLYSSIFIEIFCMLFIHLYTRGGNRGEGKQHMENWRYLQNLPFAGNKSF